LVSKYNIAYLSRMKRKKFLQWGAALGLGMVLPPLTLWGKPEESNPDVSYFTPNDTLYETLRKGFNTRIQKKPSLIAVCCTTKGVQEAVQRAIKLGIPITVKSGGHCMEGFSVEDGSMQINLSEMNKIRWVGPNTLRIGSGCTLQKLYNEIIPRKKILPGGSCAGVAIGGLSLGGGYGLLSRQFGLTCDSLQSLIMVDGKGERVDTTGNPELLWACKGGGNGNFGVITELEFKLHPAPARMSSYRFRAFQLSVERGMKLLQLWMSLLSNLPHSCFSTFLFNRNTAYILITQTGASTKALQDIITTLRSAVDKTTISAAVPLGKALKTYYGRPEPLAFKNVSAGLYNRYEELAPILPEVLEIVFRTTGMIFQFNTLGGKIQEKKFANASSFPHRGYSLFTELQTYWDTPQQGERSMKEVQNIQERLATLGVQAQYRNYPDVDSKNYETLYYGNSLERLKKIKLAFDPNNVIRHPQSIRVNPFGLKEE
jgi:FAD/FMN-containing dehydrogenase